MDLKHGGNCQNSKYSKKYIPGLTKSVTYKVYRRFFSVTNLRIEQNKSKRGRMLTDFKIASLLRNVQDITELVASEYLRVFLSLL